MKLYRIGIFSILWILIVFLFSFMLSSLYTHASSLDSNERNQPHFPVSSPPICNKTEIKIPHPPKSSPLPEISVTNFQPFIPPKRMRKHEIDEGEKWTINSSANGILFEPIPLSCKDQYAKEALILQVHSLRKRLSKMQVALLGQYFIPNATGKFASVRKLEFDACLQANLENSFISEVHLLQEENWTNESFSSFTNADKLNFEILGKQMTVCRLPII